MKIESPPKLSTQYWHAFTQTKPVLGHDQPIPRVALKVERVPIDAQALTGFRDFVGSRERFPLCFAYVLAQPAHLYLINQPAFPVRSIGLVHAQNRIERLGPVNPDQPFCVHIAIVDDHVRRRGREFILETDFHQGGALCLKMRSGYLSRVRGGEGAPERAPTDAPAAAVAAGAVIEEIEFASNFGRRYARVSGDYNPIHLTGWLARPFGFRRAIAHGIGALARIDGVLGRRLGGDTRVLDVVFKRPVELPSRPELRRTADPHRYLLRDRNGRELQLVQRLAD